MISGDALQPTDGDGFFLNSAATTCRLTRTITNAPKDAREYVGFAILHIGSGEIALRNHSDIRGNISVSWAAPLAINYLVEVFRVGSICWLHSDVHTRLVLHPDSVAVPIIFASIATSLGK